MSNFIGSLNGDLSVTGTLSAGGLNAPAGFLYDVEINADAEIQPTKVIQQYSRVYGQSYGVAATADRKVLHYVFGNTGNNPSFAVAGMTVDIRAGCVLPCVGAATITIDVKRNGSTLLNTPIVLTSAQAAYGVVIGALNAGAATLNNGDVIELVITVNASTGTLGQGVFVNVTLREHAF